MPSAHPNAAAPPPLALREITGTPTPLPSPGPAVLRPDQGDLSRQQRHVEVERGEPDWDTEYVGAAIEEAAGCGEAGFEERAAQSERDCHRELVRGRVAQHADEPRDHEDEREDQW